MNLPDSRDERRALLAVLLSRTERGALLPDERPMLRPLVEAEMSAADAETETDYKRACETIAAMHEAATGRSGEGPVRGVVEDCADVRADRDAWRERAETHEQQRRARNAVDSHAEPATPAADDMIRARMGHAVEQAARQAVELEDTRRGLEDVDKRRRIAVRELEDHRGALSHAVGLGTSAPWDAIHERALELRTINGQWADWLTAIRQTVGAATYAETPEKTKQLATAYARSGKALDEADGWVRNARNARRNKETQLDDVRRALCDTGVINDDDPYSHADLADVIRQWHQGGDDLAKQRDQAIARAERAENCPACRDPRRPHPGCPLGHLTVAPTPEQAETRHDPGHTCPDGEPCPAHDQPADDDFSKCTECGADVPHLLKVIHMRENHPDPLDTNEQPAEQRPVTLGTPCANCDHVRNFHPNGNACTHGPLTMRCGCPRFRPETNR